MHSSCGTLICSLLLLGQAIPARGQDLFPPKLPGGKTIVTILADGGSRYQSKLFNPAFLREKKLPLPRWMA